VLNWKYEKGAASISIKQMRPEWEVKLSGLVVFDYLDVVDNLWFEREESRNDKKREGTN